MTRLLQTGFEIGDINASGAPIVDSANRTIALATATPSPRSGTYCLKCTHTTGASGATGISYIHVQHGSKTDIWYSFAVYRHNSTDTAADGMFLVVDAAGNINIAISCGADGSVTAYRLTAAGTTLPTNMTSWTTIATSATTIALDTWTAIDVHYVGATGATGTVEVWINGAQVINATNVQTASTNAAVVAARFGYFKLSSTNATLNNNYIAIDDVRINDTSGSVNNGRPGDESIIMLTPNGAGDSTQWTPSAGSNYQCVDDIPPNGSTDYVSDSTVGHLDLYNMTTTPVSSVSAVSVIVQAENPDGGAGSINLVTKTAAGQSDGSAQNITSAWWYYTRLLEADPADSNAWTQAKIDALQVGVKVAS